MNKKTKLIPELRFPEFVDEGEWEEKVLSKISNAIFDGTHQTPNYIENGIPFFSVENLVSGNKNKFISRKDYKIATNKNKPEKGDILITRIGKIGFSAIVEWDYEFSIYVTLACIKSSKHFNSYYLHSYFQSSAYQKEILSKSLLNAVPCKINMNELRETKVLLPNLKEQQKIASCLSSLDEMIAAQVQKLDLLKDHKKGLMQKLFPQEGEKVPKYRFKEFDNDGEWVEKPIDKIKTILTDYVANGSFQSLRKNLNVLDSEDYAFYVRLTDLRAGLGHSNQKYVDKNTYLFLNKSSLFGGELLMANIGANVGEVWQMPFIEKPATLAPNMIMIKFKSDIDNQFIYQYLTSDIGVANISSVISGSGHPKINKTDLRQVKVFMPPKLEEQQKIASCLSFLDALITSKTEKIKQLKLHKKGLMQRLFPKIND